MADPAIGGAILGEACHFVDLMYWLLESEPTSVFSFSLPTGTKDPIGQNNLAATFSFADGSIANLTYCTIGGFDLGWRTCGGVCLFRGFGVSAEKLPGIRGAHWFCQQAFESVCGKKGTKRKCSLSFPHSDSASPRGHHGS